MVKNSRHTIIFEKSGSEKPFLIFSGFLILILPLIRLNSAQDAMLMPRLLAITLFLTLFTVSIFITKKTEFTYFSVIRNPVFMLLGFYFLVVIISAVFAVNPKEGYFDIVRTFVFIVLIFYWTQFILTTKEWFGIISKLVIIAAIIAVTIGLYQYFTMVAGNQATCLPDGRELIYAIDGLMAHKNLFSSYLMLMLPFLIFGTRKFTGNWRIAAIAMLSLVFVLIVLVATRAVWVGVVASFFIVSLIVLIFNKKLEMPKTKLRNFAIISSVSILIIGSLMMAGGRITKNDYIKKLASVVRPAEKNNHFRLDIWNITLEMAKEYPMFGVGAGNWQIIAPEYYGKLNLKDKEVNWQTPHNDFLWIFSEKGFPGLLLFLGVIALIILYVFRIITGQSGRDKKFFVLLLFSGVVAYLADSFFDFPYQRIDQQVYFSFLIAGIVAIYHQQQPNRKFYINRTVVGILMTIFLLFGVFYSYEVVQLEIHTKKAIQLMNNGKSEQVIAEIRMAENPFRTLDGLGSPLAYYEGLAYSKDNNPQKAIPYFLKALKQHPNHYALLNNLGLNYYRAGDYELASKYLLKVLQIVPSLKEARVNLSTIYYNEGNYSKSLEMLQGIGNKKKLPEIKQNIRFLNKLLGYPEDSLVKDKTLSGKTQKDMTPEGIKHKKDKKISRDKKKKNPRGKI